jgi:hypothetical protein
LKGTIGKELSLIYSNVSHFNMSAGHVEFMEPILLKIGGEYLYLVFTEEETSDGDYFYRLEMKKQSTPSPLPHEVFQENHSIQFTKPVSSVEFWSNIAQTGVLISQDNEIYGVELVLENTRSFLLTPTDSSGSRLIFDAELMKKHRNNSNEILYFT